MAAEVNLWGEEIEQTTPLEEDITDTQTDTEDSQTTWEKITEPLNAVVRAPLRSLKWEEKDEVLTVFGTNTTQGILAARGNRVILDAGARVNHVKLRLLAEDGTPIEPPEDLPAEAEESGQEKRLPVDMPPVMLRSLPEQAEKAMDYYRKLQLTKATKAAKGAAVRDVVSATYDTIYVRQGEAVLGREPGHRLHHMMSDVELSRLAIKFYETMWGLDWDDQCINNIVKGIKKKCYKEVDELDNRFIQVSNKLIWDSEIGQFTSDPDEDAVISRRLFDTDYTNKNIVKISPLTEEDEQALLDNYNDALVLLKHNQYKCDIECINTWANGNPEVAKDIIRAIAYCFIKKKPVGSYCLIGPKRNGKSTFIGLLNTIFGTRNISNVRLSELGDPHHSHQLANCYVNAVDEEVEGVTKYQAEFKTMSDHGVLSLTAFYSHEPLKVVCDFMSFFPMNHMPKWKGSGAGACMERTWAIPFFADLSRFDTRSGKNFAEKTFTKEFMLHLLGEVFALATYYTTHPLERSKEMMALQEVIAEEADSAATYLNQFKKFFNGFQSWDILWNDYTNWCKTNDYKIMTMEDFKFHWAEYKTNRRSVRVPQLVNVYCSHTSKPGAFYLTDYFQLSNHNLPEGMTKFPESQPKSFHENGWSYVAMLQARTEEALVNNYMQVPEEVEETEDE